MTCQSRLSSMGFVGSRIFLSSETIGFRASSSSLYFAIGKCGLKTQV